MSICLVSIILDEEMLIRRYLRYHRNLGIDEAVIFLDDGDKGVAERLSRMEGVTAIACNSMFWDTLNISRPEGPMERQIRCVNRGLSIARRKGHDWLIHIDIDELLHPAGQLETLLEEQGTEIVRFSIREAVSESSGTKDLYSPTMFRCIASCRRETLAKILTFSGPFFHGSFFRGHTRSKIAVRISDNLRRIRIHNATMHKESEESLCRQIHLLHFDSVGLDFWKKKWSHVKPVGDYARRSPTRRQLAEFCWRLNSKSLSFQKRMFKRIFELSPYSRLVLGRLGMIERITINQKYFHPLSGE